MILKLHTLRSRLETVFKTLSLAVSTCWLARLVARGVGTSESARVALGLSDGLLVACLTVIKCYKNL
jgi:hypothetical protein